MINEKLFCGAAKQDITPTLQNGILPMPKGYSGSDKILDTVHDPLYVRVIALKQNDDVLLLASMDIVNLDAKYFGPLLSKHTHINESAIYFIETTAHSTIRAGKDPRNGKDDEGQRKLKKYCGIVKRHLFAAADEAIANMEQVKAGVGYADSYVNVNRYCDYEYERNGKKESICGIGFNPAGASDNTVSVIRFENMACKPIAFIVNYGIFNVLMSDNCAGKNGNGAISADLAGFVSTKMESHFPGAVTLWSGGSNCDQNPFLTARMNYQDPDEGNLKHIDFSPAACDQILTYIGQINYRDTLKAVNSIRNLKGNLQLKHCYDSIKIPGLKTESEKKGSNISSIQYKENGTRTLHFALIRIGNIGLVLHGGSITAEIGLFLKENSLLKDTVIVTGFVSSISDFDGVICDDSLLKRGGHDANKASYPPGFVKPALGMLLNKMIMETGDCPYAETRKIFSSELG